MAQDTTDRGPGTVRRGASIVALLLATALLSSCSWTSGDQYAIHWGARTDIIVRERTSWDLTLASDLFYDDNNSFADQLDGFRCNGRHKRTTANRCVLRLLSELTSIPGAAKGFWTRATAWDAPAIFDDFNGEFNEVRASAHDKAQVSDCLTLSAYPHKGNWTTRARSDRNCKAGTHVWT